MNGLINEFFRDVGRNNKVYNITSRQCVRASVENDIFAINQFRVPKTSNRYETGHWDILENQRKFFINTAEALKFEKIEDLVRLTQREINSLGGSSILSKYKGNLLLSLQTIFPDKKWDSFARASQPNHFWDKIENQKEFLEYLFKKFGFKTLDDWYSVKILDVKKNGGSSLLRKYKGSLWTMLKELYPDYNWDLNYLSSKPRNYWKSIENQRQLFDLLKEKLKIISPFDWKKVNIEKIYDYGGKYLLQTEYNNDITQALPTIYPDINWKEIFYEEKEIQYKNWASIETQKLFLDNLYKILNFKSMEDWYSINKKVIINNGGSSLLSQYKSSHIKSLQSVYPDYDWNIFLFNAKPKSIWKDPKNERKYFDYIANVLNIKSQEDWYRVEKKQIMNLKGGGLLNRYNGNLFNALVSNYPEYSFDILKSRTPKTKYWNNITNVRNFIIQLKKEFIIQRKNDWYRISSGDIGAMGGQGFLYNNSLFRRRSKKEKLPALLSVLYFIYPKVKWSKSAFLATSKRSSQYFLYCCIRKYFPNCPIFENYKHPKLKYISSQNQIEFDVFIPNLEVAIEYQGAQHYEEVAGFGSNASIYSHIDRQKKEICEKNGITLIIIPFWWNRFSESLLTTLLNSFICTK